MHDELPSDAHGLIRFDHVAAVALVPVLRAAVEAGRVRRVRRGVYVRVPSPAADPIPRWERDRARYATEVRAAALTLRAPVFTSFSAAIPHGLPVLGEWPRDVYVMASTPTGSRRPGVVSVAGVYRPEVVEIDGLRCTSIEFTLIQLARHATLATAVIAMDAALFRSRTKSIPPATTLERLRAEHERRLPYPGSARVEVVLDLVADGAETPLESVSRLIIVEAGFPVPELQVPLHLPEFGRTAWLDFGWRDWGAAAEADGRGKYRTGTGDGVDAVIAEKDRENAIRRHVRAFDRWDWSDAIAKTHVIARLERMGVPRVRPARPLTGDLRSPAARPVRSRKG